MINHPVPFFSNTPDNTHCFQAAIKMVAAYLFPDKNYTWKTLNRVTAKKRGMWTWPNAGIIWLHKKKGVDIKIIDPTDNKLFIEKKGQYLIDEFGEEVGRKQIQFSNLEQEVNFLRILLKTVNIEVRVPFVEDIKELLLEGYVLICNINPKILNDKQGFVGHFVVIKGFDDTDIYMHDPGLPPLENRKIPYNLFEKAWAYPNEKAKNIVAFKKI